MVAVGLVCWLLVLVDWHSPVRGATALAFLLFGPGLVLADVLEIRDPAMRITVAFAASVAFGTLVALVLVYTSGFSELLGLTLILATTAIAALSTGRHAGA